MKNSSELIHHFKKFFHVKESEIEKNDKFKLNDLYLITNNGKSKTH